MRIPKNGHALVLAALVPLYMASTVRAAPGTDPALDILASFKGDIAVLDHYGNSLNFRRDLLRKQVVAINFIFTRCTASCPLSTANFRGVQRQPGHRPISLISITVDPSTDTPERLRAYAETFHADKSSWHFITGSKSSLDALLAQLGVTATPKEAHTNLVIVGNADKRRWMRLYGLPTPRDIIAAADDVR